MNPTELTARLREHRLLVVVRSADAEAALRTVLALAEEGVDLVEVSLTSADALNVIARATASLGPDVQVGAGTVLTAEDVHQASRAGATWFVTPAVTASITEAARLGLPVLAGAFTPTEAVNAMTAGATAVKLFPASVGGPAYLRSLRAPLPDIPFIAVGGVDVVDVPEYFEAGALAVGVGLVAETARDAALSDLREETRRFLGACRRPGASGA